MDLKPFLGYNKTMRIWTIQHKQVLTTLKKEGVYRTDERFICEPTFLNAYGWLVGEAKKRIKGWKTKRPLWFWDKRPDLRLYRWILDPDQPKEQDFVLLELEVDPRSCLRSDFDSWHMVLNDTYLDLKDNYKKYDNFYKRLPEQYRNKESKVWPKKFKEELHKSWQQVLRKGPRKGEKHQLIKDHIVLSELVKVTEFKMMNRSKKK